MGLENSDFTPKTPHSGDDGNDDKPGYPPPGQKQKLANIAAKEAVQKGNPEAILSELEGNESQDVRKSRLAKFVSDNFPNCLPENMNAATTECLDYEDQAREFLDPAYQITSKDIADLKPKIAKLAIVETNRTDIQDNADKIADATEKKDAKDQVIVQEKAGDRQDKVKINSAEIKSNKLEVGNTKLDKKLDRELSKEEQKKSDLKLIKENYPEPLKSEKGGSIGAIEALMGMVKSPKVRARLNRILGVIGALQNAIPGKAKITTKLLNASNLNLNAGSITSIFAHFATSVDHSSEYTNEEKTKIHATLKGEASVGFNATVGDMDRSLDKTRKIYDQETGKVIGEEPAFEGEENGLEVRDGVIIYTDHGQKYMKNLNTGETAHLASGAAQQGHTQAILDYWGSQEPLLEKGVEKIWGHSLKRPGIPTAQQLHNFQHYQQLLEGGRRNLDPTVQRNQEQDQFGTKYLFIAQFGETSPYGHSQEQQDKSLANLGIKTDGRMTINNPEILEEIGNWLNQNPHVSGKGSYNALQQHLNELFPDEVQPPDAVSTGEERKVA